MVLSFRLICIFYGTRIERTIWFCSHKEFPPSEMLTKPNSRAFRLCVVCLAQSHPIISGAHSEEEIGSLDVSFDVGNRSRLCGQPTGVCLTCMLHSHLNNSGYMLPQYHVLTLCRVRPREFKLLPSPNIAVMLITRCVARLLCLMRVCISSWLESSTWLLCYGFRNYLCKFSRPFFFARFG